jgi:hypothetical protein
LRFFAEFLKNFDFAIVFCTGGLDFDGEHYGQQSGLFSI